MRSFIRLLLALVVLSGCPLPPQSLPSGEVGGVWTARTAAPDGSARIITLWLEPEGKATLETVDIGKERQPLVHGSWSAYGDELTVQLQGEDGKPNPAPLVYAIGPDNLTPKQWDQNVYGSKGLPLTRRTR
jgi:hypothetical protein